MILAMRYAAEKYRQSRVPATVPFCNSPEKHQQRCVGHATSAYSYQDNDGNTAMDTAARASKEAH